MEMANNENPKPAAKKHKELSSPAEKEEEKSPFFWMYKNTCMKIESATRKITSSVEASSPPSQGNLVPTIAQAMKMVKDCRI
jgi:hypothetical protein